MRLSQMLLPTVKEDPAGAEAVSHKLMVRAGLIRQLGAGIYVFLPAGWRVMRKIEAIIRQEMDAIGCQEILMPVLNPAEIWQQSGRWTDIGDELFRLKDRKGSDMALALTHEECITWLAAREIRSYKQLPQLWYHIQTKERDEARPKSGLLRVREFIMKDSYSLDVDMDGLQESYRKHIGAYEAIYRRCGLQTMMVLSDPGMMGGAISARVHGAQRGRGGRGRLLPAVRLRRQRGARRRAAGAAGRGLGDRRSAGALAGRPALRVGSGRRAPARGAHPGDAHHRAGHGLPRHPRPAVHQVAGRRLRGTGTADGDGARRSRAARGQAAPPGRRVPHGHGRRGAGAARRAGGLCRAREARGRRARRRSACVCWPTRPCAAASTSPAPTAISIISPASRRPTSRRSSATCAPCVPATAACSAPASCAASASSRSATSSSWAPSTPSPWGPGIWTSRARSTTSSWAATASAWRASPPPPWSRTTTPTASSGRRASRRSTSSSSSSSRTTRVQRELAERLYAELAAARVPGITASGDVPLEVLFDDRELSPGVKFKDADLLGCPLQIVVGKRAPDGIVEVKRRATRERVEVSADDAPGHVLGVLRRAVRRPGLGRLGDTCPANCRAGAFDLRTSQAGLRTEDSPICLDSSACRGARRRLTLSAIGLFASRRREDCGTGRGCGDVGESEMRDSAGGDETGRDDAGQARRPASGGAGPFDDDPAGSRPRRRRRRHADGRRARPREPRSIPPAAARWLRPRRNGLGGRLDRRRVWRRWRSSWSPCLSAGLAGRRGREMRRRRRRLVAVPAETSDSSCESAPESAARRPRERPLSALATAAMSALAGPLSGMTTNVLGAVAQVFPLHGSIQIATCVRWHNN